MLRLYQCYQIFKAIVMFIPIYMMHGFVGTKNAIMCLLPNKTMFRDKSPGISEGMAWHINSYVCPNPSPFETRVFWPFRVRIMAMHIASLFPIVNCGVFSAATKAQERFGSSFRMVSLGTFMCSLKMMAKDIFLLRAMPTPPWDCQATTANTNLYVVIIAQEAI